MKINRFWSIMMMLVFIIGALTLSSCDKCKCGGDCHGTKCAAPCADDCRCTWEQQPNLTSTVVGIWSNTYEESFYQMIKTFVLSPDGTGTWTVVRLDSHGSKTEKSEIAGKLTYQMTSANEGLMVVTDAHGDHSYKFIVSENSMQTYEIEGDGTWELDEIFTRM